MMKMTDVENDEQRRHCNEESNVQRLYRVRCTNTSITNNRMYDVQECFTVYTLQIRAIGNK